MVQSGSMEPAVKTGGVVFVKKTDDANLNKGDVITFYTDDAATRPKNAIPTTHRIFEVQEEGFTTKGDANEDPDQELVRRTQVLGKVVFDLPYLGYVVNFSKSQLGFIVLIVIPATLIVYGELGSIKKEIGKMKAKKSSKAEEAKAEINPKAKKKKVAKEKEDEA